MLTELSRIVTPPRMRMWKQDGWYLYFDPANFAWTRVNESGRYLMELLRRHWTPERIAARVQADFGVSRDEALAAVNGFVNNLVVLGFLHRDEYRPRERAVVEDRSFPLHIYLHMTNECNLKCPYCYNKDDREFKLKMEKLARFAPQLSTDEYKHLISRSSSPAASR